MGTKSLLGRALNLILGRWGWRISRTLAEVPRSSSEHEPSVEGLANGYFEEQRFKELIDYDPGGALKLLETVFPLYRDEYLSFPLTTGDSKGDFFLNNGFFESVDAEVLYCIVRHYRPRKVIEVGSGYSSLLIRKALDQNPQEGSLLSIDPNPTTEISGRPDSHLQVPVEKVKIEQFEALGEGDILFVDASHWVKTGGDVNFVFFEVLPALKAGVFVHFHDIFLPREYPDVWVLEEKRGYTEQYLLLAFLVGNSAYRVVWPGMYMRLNHYGALKAAFPSCGEETAPGSFWIRKIESR